MNVMAKFDGGSKESYFSDVSLIYMMIGIPLISGPLSTTSAVGNMAQISGHGGCSRHFVRIDGNYFVQQNKQVTVQC